MGVIKENSPKQLFASSSEESLHIPLESDEEEVQQTPPDGAASQTGPSHMRRRKPCVPMSFSQAGRKKIGKRRSRRYENVAQLVTLVEEEEFGEVTINEFITPTKTPFQILLEDEHSLKAWNSFVNSTEEVQQLMISNRGFKTSKRDIYMPSIQSAEEAFNAISRPLQNILQNKAPLAMVAHMEDEIIGFFSTSPQKSYISPLLNGFERLVLHGIAEYYHLISTSLAAHSCNERKVRIRNPMKIFSSPTSLLAEYLEERQISKS